MNDFIIQFQEVYANLPHIVWGAGLFYVSFAMLLVPTFRALVEKFYSPIQPATQSLLKPLDSLRGLAALSSAGYHLYIWGRPFFDRLVDSAPFFRSLYKSVPFFAVLSGFLIYRSVRTFQQLESFRGYAKRRILRTFPLYAASVLFCFLFIKVTPAPESWFQRLIPEFFMLRILGYPNILYPGHWSLYVEELFYISVPIWILSTRRSPRLAACLGLALFSLIGNAISDELALFKYFFMGILLCEFMDTPLSRRMNQWASGGVLALGVVFLVGEELYGDFLGRAFAFVVSPIMDFSFAKPFQPGEEFPRIYTMSLGISFGLITLGVLLFKPVSHVLSWFPFRFLGTISYSLFIWNGLMLLYGSGLSLHPTGANVSGYSMLSPVNGGWLVLLSVYVPSFIFVASISYLLIERPFLMMRLKARSKADSKPALVPAG